MRLRRTTIISAAIAHGLSWAALLFLVFWPATYQGVSAIPEPSSGIEQPAEQERFTASLIEVNGWDVLPVLFIPILLSGVGLVAALTRNTHPMVGRIALWGSVAFILVFCLIGIFSIGMFYLPSALALIIAAIAGSGHLISACP
jgi:hypothetical protein